MKLGDVEVIPLSDGAFRLDGGAMFGIVPKPAWEKRIAPDAQNRIRLALRPILVRTRGICLLMDTGIGEKHDARFGEVYGVEDRPRLLESLRTAGVRPEDVTHVTFTHLHLDHAGGATRWARPPAADRPGEAVPLFPRARHLVQRQEWEAANAPDPRSRGSYRGMDFEPFARAGLLDLVDGDFEVAPEVRLRVTSGHTRAHQGLEVKAGGETAFYFGDLVPTAAHLDAAWVMGYDLDPANVSRVKEKLVAQAEAERWIVILDHDPGTGCGRVRRDGKRYVLEPLGG